MLLKGFTVLTLCSGKIRVLYYQYLCGTVMTVAQRYCDELVAFRVIFRGGKNLTLTENHKMKRPQLL